MTNLKVEKVDAGWRCPWCFKVRKDKRDAEICLECHENNPITWTPTREIRTEKGTREQW